MTRLQQLKLFTKKITRLVPKYAATHKLYYCPLDYNGGQSTCRKSRIMGYSDQVLIHKFSYFYQDMSCGKEYI